MKMVMLVSDNLLKEKIKYKKWSFIRVLDEIKTILFLKTEIKVFIFLSVLFKVPYLQILPFKSSLIIVPITHKKPGFFPLFLSLKMIEIRNIQGERK